MRENRACVILKAGLLPFFVSKTFKTFKKFSDILENNWKSWLSLFTYEKGVFRGFDIWSETPD